MRNLNDGKGFPMSADPEIILCDVVAEKSSVFSSNARPLRLPFRYRKFDEEELRQEIFMMMFKKGDDIRQDQLCL
jgi:hypothetical protein